MTRPLATAPVLLLALAVTAGAQTYHSVRQAAVDPAVATLAGGVMLSLPGVFTDFVLAGGGQYVELPNGTARLTARVYSEASIYSAFLLDLTLSGREVAGNPGYPPAGCPNQQLVNTAYAPSGPVDPNTFVYYTNATGTLTGVREYDGALLSLTSSGAVQLGTGANNRNTGPGLQADFTVAVVQQPSNPLSPAGTAALTLDFRAPTAEPTTHPQPDPLRTTLLQGRALVLPGVANDYVFVPAAGFTEYGDGHAELNGTLARTAQLDDSWDVAISFTNRVTAGEPAHPPAGSPVLQMLPGAYAANGGPIDPSCWHYYTSAGGTLTGTGLNAGGSIALAGSSALQVGGGANQANTYFGFYGALVPTLVSQPTARTLALSGSVELFGLTAVFPVLPFPTLVVPATMPVLDTLTDQGFVLQGDNLAWVELMALNWDLAGGRDARAWHAGWFRVIDNQHVEFHPRPGQAPGIYNCFGYNPAVPTNTIQVQLVAPTAPKLFAEPTVASLYTTHVMLHSGPVTGPALSLVVLSQTLGASVAPGIATLDIGGAFSDVLLDPSAYLHDPVTGIAAANYGPINPSLAGLHYWFQGLVLDFGALQWPLPATNPWRVDFVL